ncbi:DUF2855 family protein [Hoeflea sp. WL0058]|uniref:DUF2855 family protein n=1 Tax=Flavimaribacter sediminis TaxID=2865987 RepID=A0AAE2ZPB5_9HYPH|nr:DUF2855 family protein [Flavimaribacter sediminis]MBW8637993.1 DUF2855 family protein [Flavimaribacter sediminis]
MQQFQVRKDDLSKHRLVEETARPLTDGEIRVRVARFALTANNVTYGVVGEKIGYWKFFEAADNADGGWGVIPVWGFAEIVESNTPDVSVGDRIYGYFPMADELVMRPTRVSDSRMIDGVAHRADLPPVYNSYARIPAAASRDLDNERMLLHPLYATSFCLHDFLVDNGWFGAERLIIVSASGKTAIGLAYAVKEDESGLPTLGLTSPRNRAFVESLGLYDTVLDYDQIASVPDAPSVIVDMSGSGPVLSALHRRLGDNMRFCSNVGLSHWDDNQMGPDFIRERSSMFFAPGHIKKRAGELGPGEFESRANAFWERSALRSRDWLKLKMIKSLPDAVPVFEELRAGLVTPETGIVVAL